MPIKRQSIPPSLYQYLVIECRGVCSLCHENIISNIHHIVPAAEGGPSKYENLIPLCASCHSKVHKTSIGRQRLRLEKTRWTRQCVDILSHHLLNATDAEHRKKQLLMAFDVLENIKEFEGFQSRLEEQLRHDTLFTNFFRVVRHDICKRVDASGNCEGSETQVFSPFVPFTGRHFYRCADYGVSSKTVAFEVKTRMRGRSIGATTSLLQDEPCKKIYKVAFELPIPAKRLVEMELSYFWPKAWRLREDRYTYDVLAWAEKVNYEMIFSRSVQVKRVSTSFIDIFKREWPDIGTSRITRNGFQWTGARLPMFSCIVIKYEANVAA